jgi:hypothetical protein
MMPMDNLHSWDGEEGNGREKPCSSRLMEGMCGLLSSTGR